MSETPHDLEPGKIIAAAQEAELELIAEEQKAVKKLGGARQKLDKELRNLEKAQTRVDERRAEVEKSERALAAARERRLAGSTVRSVAETRSMRDSRSEPPVRDE